MPHTALLFVSLPCIKEGQRKGVRHSQGTHGVGLDMKKDIKEQGFKVREKLFSLVLQVRLKEQKKKKKN